MTKPTKIEDIETGFYGIYLEKWSDGYYLFSSNGYEEMFSYKPTQSEIEEFIEQCMYMCGNSY